MKGFRRVFWALVVVQGLWGCSQDVTGQNQRANGENGAGASVVRAYFDLEGGVVPTPTDLVRGEGGLEIGVPEGATAAQAEFLGYLNGLDGYPLGSAVEIPLSGAIDEATLAGSVLVIDGVTGERVSAQVTFDGATNTIEAQPGERLAAGRRYLVALLGYERGVRGADGRQVVSDSAFFLVKSEQSLRDHVTAMPGATLEEREAQAQALAALQEEFQPGFDALAQRGIERDEVAVLSFFTTTAGATVRFDAANGEIPMPNDLLRDEASGTLELPLEGAEGDELRLLEALREYDGFSTTGAIQVLSSAALTREQEAGVVRLFEEVGEGVWEEVEALKSGVLERGDTYWIRPELALEPATNYVYVVSKGLKTATGAEHQADPLGALLMLEAPLVEEGKSAVSVLGDEEALRVEGLRLRVEGFLRARSDIERGELAAVVPFRTLSTMEGLLERRAELYTRDVTTAVVNIETTTPSGAARLLMNHVETVIRGEMTVLDYIDPATGAFRADGEAEERLVKFALTLPKGQSVVDPIPVVLFGHGLATSRELLYLIADPLAEAGFAAFSVDLPFHGDRTPCSRDSQCVGGATCDAVGQCRNGDGSEAQMIQASVPYLSPLFAGTQYDELINYPSGSGEKFIDVHDVVATRDHFAQAYLDLQQALRVIQGGELADVVADPENSGLYLDGTDVVYLGMSLGGILGAGMSALEPGLEDFVLNVPAADLPRVIENSASFRDTFDSALLERGIERGDDGYFRFINGLRWLFDPVDPVNLVQHSVREPYGYVDPLSGEVVNRGAVRMRIQMAKGDLVVPNEGTEALSERSGVAIGEFEPTVTNHGFLFDPNPFAFASRDARAEVVEFFLNR